MDKLTEFLTKNMSLTILSILGILSPGILTVGIFNRELFIALDCIKLVLLSTSISMPTASAIFLLNQIWAHKIEDINIKVEMAVALTENILIFGMGIIVKIFYRDMKLSIFTLLICILAIALVIMNNREGKLNKSQ